MTLPQGECSQSTPAQNTLHHWQSGFLALVATAANPAMRTTSERMDGLSREVTERSKAAGLPLNQFETRMSAGRVCWSSCSSPLPASALALMQAGWHV